MAETRHSFCRICESLCGLELEVDEGQITKIRPNKAHVATRGFACIKGLQQHKMYDSPDRLRYPEKRIGDRWERISWEQALQEIGAKLRSLRADHGPDSVAMYLGTPVGFNALHPHFAQGFIQGLGSTNFYENASQDCSNKWAVARDIYGFPYTQPFPDIDRTHCLIMVGANPVVSKWTFINAPDPIKRLREIEERGGNVWVVDPRRNETARVAGQHVFIRPDTDVFFFLSFLNELVHTRGVDRDRVASISTGFEAVEKLAREWPPERTASVTKIPPETLREMVKSYREAPSACLYSSTGVNMGTNGSLSFWLQEVINAASGNLDRRGGSLVGRGIFDFPKFGVKNGFGAGGARSRVGDFEALNDCFPGGILADEILTPGEGQVRGLIVSAGNPLLSFPNSARLRSAFEDLELLVSLDIYRNETGSLAHYTLPCTTPFERPDTLFFFYLLLGMQAKPYLQGTEQIVEPDGEQRDEPSIFLDLCKAAGFPIFGSKLAQRVLEWSTRLDRRRRRGKGGLPGVPQEFLLSVLLRLSRQGSFRGLAAHPNGRLRPEHEEGDFLENRIVTPNGKINLAPQSLLSEAEKLEADFAREQGEADRLKLITRRTHATHNSWTHNIDELVPREHTNHLYIHPDDAAKIGLGNGDLADVQTETAVVRIPVRLLADLMPGTVALPHGWGHQVATGLSVAASQAGVNANLLAADGPDKVENFSGMANLTGFVVDVRPATGPLDPSSWSGVSAP